MSFPGPEIKIAIFQVFQGHAKYIRKTWERVGTSWDKLGMSWERVTYVVGTSYICRENEFAML